MKKENVSVAVTGAIYWIPAGSGITVTGTTDLENTEAIALGYISEDGVSISDESDRSWLKAWQHNRNVRQITEETAVNITASLIENTAAVRELYFRNKSTGTTSSVIDWKPAAQVNGTLVVDYIDTGWTGNAAGESLMGRFVFSDASVSETEEITLANGDAVAYGLTWVANADSTGSVAKIYNIVLTAGEDNGGGDNGNGGDTGGGGDNGGGGEQGGDAAYDISLQIATTGSDWVLFELTRSKNIDNERDSLIEFQVSLNYGAAGAGGGVSTPVVFYEDMDTAEVNVDFSGVLNTPASEIEVSIASSYDSGWYITVGGEQIELTTTITTPTQSLADLFGVTDENRTIGDILAA